MKLSNQNIYNLRGHKNFWGRCQMPLGGANHFWGVRTPPHPPENLCVPYSRAFDCGFCLFGRAFDQLFFQKSNSPGVARGGGADRSWILLVHYFKIKKNTNVVAIS